MDVFTHKYHLYLICRYSIETQNISYRRICMTQYMKCVANCLGDTGYLRSEWELCEFPKFYWSDLRYYLLADGTQ